MLARERHVVGSREASGWHVSAILRAPATQPQHRVRMFSLFSDGGQSSWISIRLVAKRRASRGGLALFDTPHGRPLRRSFEPDL